MLRTVSTVHKAGFDQYGTKCLAGIKHWPGEVVFYTEGFDLPEGRAKGIRNETLPKLAQFKAKWQHYVSPDWRYDVVRFANKVYAMYDALREHDDIGVWMDADIVTSEPLPEAYLRSLLPKDYYLALFQREGMHSETGLYLMDCRNPQHKRFLDTFLALYEQGTFRDVYEWHDCALMDATIRAFTKHDLIKVHNLSGEHSKTNHPMAKHPIARYASHLKGPRRKELGYCPETEQTKAAA